MDSNTREVATLAGGCFWCLEAVYEQLRGVGEVVSGYTGGDLPDPSYEQICTGGTGHAEVVQIVYDTQEISFRDILEVFFAIHDPTTLNRQGPDTGTQYRSAIFYHSPEQKLTTEQVIEELGQSGVWDRPIVTQVGPLSVFYPGEEYHQQYYRRNWDQPYCQAIIAPKVAKFRKEHLARLRTESTVRP